MIVRYSNGDELHFPNIAEKNTCAEPAAPAEKAWVRDKKGNWVRG